MLEVKNLQPINENSMGLFGDIFKRKPGGTFVGNLLRGGAKAVANVFVPGGGALVGNGAMMITQEDADKRDLTDAQFIAKYGLTKAGLPPQNGALKETFGAALNGAINGVNNLNNAGLSPTGTITSGAVKSDLMNWGKIIGLVLLAIGGIFLIKKLLK